MLNALCKNYLLPVRNDALNFNGAFTLISFGHKEKLSICRTIGDHNVWLVFMLQPYKESQQNSILKNFNIKLQLLCRKNASI